MQDLYIQLIRDSVPVIVVFTKFDQVVTIEDRNSARIEALAWYEQSCRPLFRSKARDVPAEIVSGSSFIFCGMALDDLIYSQ